MQDNKTVSLLNSHPELSAEAFGWDPSEYTAGSGQKKDWKCSVGHVWQAPIYDRAKKSFGCPYCSGKRFLSGLNDLATKYPEVAKEAFGWDPTLETAASNKKLSWKCNKGHVWEARVGNRTVKGYGCPFCSNQRVLKGFNDLQSKFPDIAKEAFGWDPSTAAPFSNRKLEWRCKFGHIWKSTIQNRTIRNDGCAVCSSHKTLAGFNDLLTTNPELAKEAIGWDPSSVTSMSNKKVNWRCENNHEWSAPVSSRTSGSGCPVCAGKIVNTGFNDLETKNIKLAKEANGWDPRLFTKSSNKVVAWKCPLGHIYKASINNRSAGSGCPVCAGKQVLTGFNDLATTYPELAKEAFEWDPQGITSGSHKKVKWKCSIGHIFEASVANRARGTNCPYCSNQKVLAGFNDLATTHPYLIPFTDGWDPRKYLAGSKKRMPWRCDKGHLYVSPINDRIRAKYCPYCSNQRVLAGFNDLRTTNPDIASSAHGWDPTTVLAGSDKKLSWKCEEGHIWKSPVYHRTGRDKTGCPTCAKTGFDPNSDGYFYFLRHEDWEMLQIGITNVPDDRLSRHKRLGWKIIELRGPMDGYTTQELETAVLRMLKKQGAKLSPHEIAGKFDGYSEAWIESSYPVKSIHELLANLRDYESTNSPEDITRSKH